MLARTFLAVSSSLLAFSLAAAPAAAASQEPPAGEAAVRAAATRFLDALNALDADAISAQFTADVTAFVPLAQGERADGKAAVSLIFRRFVEKTKPAIQRLNLVPEDLTAETSGNLGVVTFNIREKDVTRRRTIIFRRGADGTWLVCHLHASDFFAK